METFRKERALAMEIQGMLSESMAIPVELKAKMTPPAGTAKKAIKSSPKYSSRSLQAVRRSLLKMSEEDEDEDDSSRGRAMSAQSKRNKFNMRNKRRQTGFRPKDDSDSD